jgi:hypothetical protein
VLIALTFWGAARIPVEHPSVELFVDLVLEKTSATTELETSLRAVELVDYFGV